MVSKSITRTISRAVAREINGEKVYDPLPLFDGVDGVWLSIADKSSTFEQAGTPSDANDDPIGLILDKSGNGNDAFQNTGISKVLLKLDTPPYRYAQFDGNDDSINFDVPVGGWSGTYVQGTMNGVIVGEISVPAGTYQIPTNPAYANLETLTDLFIFNDGGAIDPVEFEELIAFVAKRGQMKNFTGVTSIQPWFRQREDLIKIDLTRWDLSSLTSGDFFIRQSPNLQTMVIGDIETPSLTTMVRFAEDCTSLTTVEFAGSPENSMMGSPCTSWNRAFQNTNLSQQSYTDIVTAIESAGTSNGTLDVTGGSATTTGSAQTAVDALRLRGWTVTTPDGY